MFSLESIVGFSEWTTAVLILVASVFAVIALFGGRTIRRSERLAFANLEIKTEEYREKAARVELEVETAKEGTANAKRYAAEATKLAKSFELDIAKSNEKAANAEAKVSEANRGWEEAKGATALAMRDFESQRERAAKAEKDMLLLRTEFQEKFKPREITAEQESRLSTLLTVNRLPGKVVVSCIAGDPEAMLYARRIFDILSKAGWTLGDFTTMMDWVDTGVLVVVKSNANPPARAGLLINAFGMVGITLIGKQFPQFNDDDVTIFVGKKP